MKIQNTKKIILLLIIAEMLYYWPSIFVPDLEHSWGERGIIIYYFCVFPILSVIYGILSYKITQKVLRPNLTLCVCLSAIEVIIIIFKLFATLALDPETLKNWEPVLGRLGIGFVFIFALPVISIVVSAIVKYISDNKSK